MLRSPDLNRAYQEIQREGDEHIAEVVERNGDYLNPAYIDGIAKGISLALLVIKELDYDIQREADTIAEGSPED